MLPNTFVKDESTDDLRALLMVGDAEGDEGEDEEDGAGATGSGEDEEDPTEWMRTEEEDDDVLSS
jgi:hypothetical protein